MNKTWICLGATLLSLNLVGYTLPVPKGKTHEPRPAASSQVSPSRATLVKRVKAGLASLRTAPASYQAGIKEVPDYGINSETWQYDGDSAEGMVYFQFPGNIASIGDQTRTSTVPMARTFRCSTAGYASVNSSSANYPSGCCCTAKSTAR